jgi:hypothetical protein
MIRFSGRRALGALVLLAALAAGGPLAVSGPVSAHSAGAGALGLVHATKFVIFHPSGTPKSSVSGNCGMGESSALDRVDAWRCIVGNEIYDPCFSARPHATSVICDASPLKPAGFILKLATPLPTHLPVHNKQVWMMKLGDGVICGFLSGATGGIGQQRINYGCTDKTYVLGYPQAQGKVWYATQATLLDGEKASAIWAISVNTFWM